MKVVHVLKRLEAIDQDIKDLKKLERSLTQNKSFTTPIYLSIEKQINNLIGEKVKLIELVIANPPADFVNQNEDVKVEAPGKAKKSEKKSVSKPAPKIRKKKSKKARALLDDDLSGDIVMLTQDQIDKKFLNVKKDKSDTAPSVKSAGSLVKDAEDARPVNDEQVKLLDIALEKGTINKTDVEKEKKKVRFFRDNFPGD
jgi:hypothetical protein